MLLGTAIVKDSGAFSGVFTAAHELGQALGATPDGNNNCCCSEGGIIMYASLTAPLSLIIESSLPLFLSFDSKD